MAETPSMPHSFIGLLTFLAMISGCCSLAYEILYMRALTTVFGDMFYVHAALLSTFLIGIGVGSKLAHYCFRWLFAFEIFTGIYACALPFILDWLLEQPFLGQITATPSLTILSVIFLLSIPSLFIGFSLPLFSGYIKSSSSESLAFQSVYTVYNLGALVSILGVEYWLIRRLGVNASLQMIGAVNLTIGALLILARKTPKTYPKTLPKKFSRYTILALAIASLCSAVFQMFVLKLFYLIFEPHRENFAIGLAVTFLGIFIGALFASKYRIRFETCMLCIPISIGIIYWNYLPILHLYQNTVSWTTGSEWLIFFHKFFIACLFELVPMAFFGALLPALMRNENEVSTESGYLLWISSTANASGYLLYVLVGHPYLTTNILFAFLALFSLLSSALEVKFRWSKSQLILALVGLSTTGLCVAEWKEERFYLAQWVNEIRPHYQIFNFKNGAENATLVKAKTFDWITYNGNASVYAHRNGIVNFAEIANGIVPALVSPRLDRALVFGLGTGITAGTAARIFKKTDVVEINKGFYQMMPMLEYASMEIGKNPSVDIHILDGRAFLIGKEGIYDAIINSVTTPDYFSAAKLYTSDFYHRIAKALKPDGIFSMYLVPPLLTNTGAQTILSALRKNFKYCELHLFRNGYYMLTCSNQPMRNLRFHELPLHEKLQKQLANQAQLFSFEEYFEDIRLSNNLFETYNPQEEVVENTDDFPIVEFLAVRLANLQKSSTDLFLTQQELLNIDPIRAHEIQDPERMARRAGVFYHFSQRYYKANFVPFFEKNPLFKEAFEKWLKAHPKSEE